MCVCSQNPDEEVLQEQGLSLVILACATFAEKLWSYVGLKFHLHMTDERGLRYLGDLELYSAEALVLLQPITYQAVLLE